MLKNANFLVSVDEHVSGETFGISNALVKSDFYISFNRVIFERFEPTTIKGRDDYRIPCHLPTRTSAL